MSQITKKKKRDEVGRLKIAIVPVEQDDGSICYRPYMFSEDEVIEEEPKKKKEVKVKGVGK